MKKILTNNLKTYKDFLVIENEKFEIVFSTAEKNRSFNRNTEEGLRELESLKEDFKVSSVQYLKQTHSCNVFKYNGESDFINNEGDSIITNKKNVAIGVFTADCVPVLLMDEENTVVAAIHSGWRGTFSSIVKNTIKEMKKNYNTNSKSVKAYIGPHIRQCCYEVSEELKNNFIDKFEIDKEILFKGRNLSLEECIYKDLVDSGVSKENIYTLEICTHCASDIKVFSYRKSEGTYGRLFSFLIIK